MQSITVTYTDSKLRILIEEFIAMQRTQFTFPELCSYIIYRAMEEGRTATSGLYDSNQMADTDAERVKAVLEKIVKEGRINKSACDKDIVFVK